MKESGREEKNSEEDVKMEELFGNIKGKRLEDGRIVWQVEREKQKKEIRDGTIILHKIAVV